VSGLVSIAAVLLGVECVALWRELRRTDERLADRDRVIASQASVVKAQKDSIAALQQMLRHEAHAVVELRHACLRLMPADLHADSPACWSETRH
jgi:hypothetical protein